MSVKFNLQTKALAFTLAEVLITLGIIGIIASLTIPTLVKNYQNQVFATKLKQDYSLWQNALNEMAVDSGCPGDIRCFFTSDHSVKDFTKYFKIARICDESESNKCFPQTYATYYDGTHMGGAWSDPISFVTVNGMSVWSPYEDWGWSNNCNNGFVCIQGLYIDVNGLKKPNVLGRDIFEFEILYTNWVKYGWPSEYRGLIPYGVWNYSGFNNLLQSNKCTSEDKEGDYCAARIMGDGWKINY